MENPESSILFKQEKYVRTFGKLGSPKPGWSFCRSERCQFKVVHFGKDDPGRPIQKAVIWLANFDLSSLELRCGNPSALVANSHEHRHARGSMQVEGKGNQCVAEYTGKCTPEQSAMYAKACATFVNGVGRISARRDRTDLRALADKSSVALQASGAADLYRSHGTPQYLLGADDYCVDLVGHTHKSSPLRLSDSRQERQ